jgi:hypothetical protein
MPEESFIAMFRNKFTFEIRGKWEMEPYKFKPVSAFYNLHTEDQDCSITICQWQKKYGILKEHKSISYDLE